MPVNTFSSPGALDTLQIDADIVQSQRTGGTGSYPTASLGALTVAQIGGGVLNGGAGGSAVSLAVGGTVTIGSGVRVVRISVAAIAGALNLPTDSVDGRDITVINAGTATLTLVTNAAGGGFSIASGAAAKMTWDVASTLWYHNA